MDSITARAILNHTGIVGELLFQPLYGKEYEQYLAQKKIADEKLQAEKAAAEAAEREAQRINADNAKVIAARAAAAKAETELTQKLDGLTKNDLTNSIRAVYKEVDELKKKGADVKLIDEYKLAKQRYSRTSNTTSLTRWMPSTRRLLKNACKKSRKKNRRGLKKALTK